MLRVILKLRRAHAVKKIIQANLLCAVNPLSRRIDLGVCLHGGNHGGSGHVHFARFFDDPLQGRPDVPLAFWEESKRVRVPVDAGPVCQPEFLRNGRRGTPADEGCFDLFPLLMAADRTTALVPAKAHRCVCFALLAHAAIVFRQALPRKARNALPGEAE